MNDDSPFQLDRAIFDASNAEVKMFGRVLRRYLNYDRKYCLVPLTRPAESVPMGLGYMVVTSIGAADDYVILRPVDIEEGAFHGLRGKDVKNRFLFCIDRTYDDARARISERSVRGVLQSEQDFAGGLYIADDSGVIRTYEFDAERIYRKSGRLPILS